MTTVAAFDFDGTLCKGDAVVPFLAYLRGPARTGLALGYIAPLLRTRDRDVMKRALSKKLLTGVNESDLNRAGEDFALKLVNRKVSPQVLERLKWHQKQGHKTILASASYDAYLKHVVRQLAIDSLISTRIEIVEGVATGNLVDGINVRSTKKAELLREALPDDQVELYAYGNSSGDIPMLALADHPFMVDRRGNITSFRT